MARAGQSADPPEQPPEGLRRVLRFRTLQTAALDTVRRVLESDEAFRLRVVEAVEEDELGRLAWVWLTRPDGWIEELARLAADARQAEEPELDDRSIARLRRALIGAEEAGRRHETEATREREAARRAQTELGEARSARRAAERVAAEARAQAERANADLDALARSTQATGAEVDRLRAELDVARTALHEAESELALEREAAGSGGGSVARTDGREGDASAQRLDVRGLGDRVRAAQLATVDLARALEEMAGLLATPCAESANAAVDAAGHARQTPKSDPRGGASSSPRPRSRQPAPMPPGVWDDAPEAAAHLVRLPGAAVLVDGYNVARTAWPGLTPEEERGRLITALEELHARTGAEVIVVFDGVQAGSPMPGQGSRTVRVRFSAAGVQADDVVRDLVDEYPPQRPVVVVSSDREVADGARARGANAVSSRQFLAVLGR